MGMFDSPRRLQMERVVERLRDARQRVRLGIPIADQLDALLDDAAELLEEAETDVQALFALEMQVGESFRGTHPAEPDPKLEARLAELKGSAPCTTSAPPKETP